MPEPAREPEPAAETPKFDFPLAVALLQQGRLAEAERVLLEVVRQEPANPDAWHLRGVIAHQIGQPDRAVALIGRAIELNERTAGAHNNRGIPLRILGRLDEALASFDRAIVLEPDDASAHNNRGITLRQMGRLKDAFASFETAIALRPDYPEAHNNHGILLRSVGQFAEALASFDRAVALYPDYAEALGNRGNVLRQLGRLDASLASYDRAIALRPNHVEAHVGRGNALLMLNRHEEALSSFDRAIELNPDFAAAHGDRGNALMHLRRPAEALASYDRAIALNPADPGSHYSRGELLRADGRIREAVASMDSALAADPLHAVSRLAACMTELPIVYRSEAEIVVARQRYIAALERLDAATGDPAIGLSVAREIGAPPFYLPYQGKNDVVPQAAYGRIVSRILNVTMPAVPLASRPGPRERIRVGIVSGFFCAHTVFKLFLDGWLREIDRARFEVIGFHTTRISDGSTALAAGLCDRFVRDLPSKAMWRQAIADAAPHVLIYPEFGMDAMVGWLAAQRLAPVQCVTWGHPETTGMRAMDYFLSSDLMEPPGAEEHYTERLVRLPRLALHYTPDETPIPSIQHAELGLDPAVPIFWSGQSLFKYLPQHDWVFPRIAQAVGECRFIFVSTLSDALTAIFRERLDRAFAAFGLDTERYCVILPKMPHDRFISVAGLADVILDPPSWSGGRSTLDCLAVNPAIVTFEGPFMRSRHTAAILRQIGCEETIASTLEEYVTIAARLGTDTVWRSQVRETVANGKHRAFRDLDYVRALETFLADVAMAGPPAPRF
jgi:protein O-GlcNAc transferase